MAKYPYFRTTRGRILRDDFTCEPEDIPTLTTQLELDMCRNKLADLERGGIPACITKSGKGGHTYYNVWREGIEQIEYRQPNDEPLTGEIIESVHGFADKYGAKRVMRKTA